MQANGGQVGGQAMATPTGAQTATTPHHHHHQQPQQQPHHHHQNAAALAAAAAAAAAAQAPVPTNPYQGYNLTNVDMSSFQGVDWGSMYGMGMYV